MSWSDFFGKQTLRENFDDDWRLNGILSLIVKSSQVFADQSEVFLENNFNGFVEKFWDKSKQKVDCRLSSIDTLSQNVWEINSRKQIDVYLLWDYSLFFGN